MLSEIAVIKEHISIPAYDIKKMRQDEFHAVVDSFNREETLLIPTSKQMDYLFMVAKENEASKEKGMVCSWMARET